MKPHIREALLQAHSEGLSVTEAAAFAGCSRPTVRAYAQSLGVEFAKGAQGRKIDWQPYFAVANAYAEGKPLSEIGRQFGVTPVRIGAMLKKIGINASTDPSRREALTIRRVANKIDTLTAPGLTDNAQEWRSLSFEKCSEWFRLDPETGLLFWKKKPNRNMDISKPAGGVVKGYHHVSVEGVRYYSHRVVWCLYHGSPPTTPIDHINGDQSDNMPVNLRACTTSQNGMNRGVPVNNKTGVKGVFFDKRVGRYAAQISAGGKAHWLGSYESKAAAADAYRRAAQRLHGEFARCD